LARKPKLKDQPKPQEKKPDKKEEKKRERKSIFSAKFDPGLTEKIAEEEEVRNGILMKSPCA